MAVPGLPSLTGTVLFTDIKGSTRRWEQRPEAVRWALVRHDTNIEKAVARRCGVALRRSGDGHS